MKQTSFLKKSAIGLAIIAFLGIALCTIYIQLDRSFDNPVSIPVRATPNDWYQHIKIGVVGDSWVAGHKLDQAIEQTMKNSGIDAEVVSSGHPGAKSRLIYRDLTNSEQSEHSSNHILMDEDVDYLVVVAGVNDTAGHIGAEFYAHHIFRIIQAALDRGIKPIIVEVPEYGIEETPTVSFLSWGKRLIYLWLFDHGNVDVIQEYRKALFGKIPSTMTGKVVFVDFSSITDDYINSKDLFANPSHLNNGGWKKLGELIAESIIKSHNKSIQTDRE